jgi:hypothetical protein
MVPRTVWGLAGLLAFFLVFSSSAWAVNEHAYPFQLELRSDSHSGWDSDITARNNDNIDVRLLVSLDGDLDSSDVDSYVKVEGRLSNQGWQEITRLSNSRFMQTGTEQTVYWYSAFRASNAYSEYRVQGFSRAFGENYNASDYAFISSVGSQLQCQDIKINAQDISLNKNSSDFFSLEIRNDTDEDFTVDSVTLDESSSFFSIDRQDFDRQIAAGDIGFVDFRVNSFSVSSNQSASVTVRVTGHFDNQTCSSGMIPVQTFLVTVRNEGSGSSAFCSNVSMTTFPVFVPENSSTVKTVVVNNNSSDRFLLSQPQLEENSTAFSATIDSFDSSIAPFSQGSIRIRIASGNVSGSQTDSLIVKVNGSFEDGGSCSSSDIRSAVMTITVQEQASTPSCGLLNGAVSETRMGSDEEKEVIFRLQNNSGTRFDLSELALNPDIANFSLQRITSVPLSVSPYQEAEIRLRARTSNFDREQRFSVPLQVRGSFADGTSCGLSETFFFIPFFVSPENEETGNNEGICGEIDIESHSVYLDAGQSIEEEFFVKNNSGRTFFVDGIEAYDYSSNVTVSPSEFDNSIRPGERGSIRAEIDAEDSSSDRTATGYLKVRGHFEGTGQYCSTGSVGSKSFSIQINGTESGSGSGGGGTVGNCGSIHITPPNSLFVNQNTPLSFSVDNPTSGTVFVFLRGAGITVSPNSFSIASHSNKAYSATVQYFNREPSRLEFVPIGNNCQGSIQYTTVYSTASNGGFEPPSNGEIKIVQAPSQLVFAKRTTVIATIHNNSAVTRNISVHLDGFSPNWQLDKLTVGFAAFETKTIYLDAYSNNTIGSFTGTLVAESGNQSVKQVLKLASVEQTGFGNDFQLQTNAQGTGPNTVKITAQLQNNSSQQAQGVASLETIDGAVLQQNNFTSNPGTVSTISFSLAGSNNQPLPNAVNVRTILDDGRGSVQRVELSSGLIPGIGIGQGIAGFFSLLSVSDWALLLGIVVLLFILIIWLAARKPIARQPYQKTGLVAVRSTTDSETTAGPSATLPVAPVTVAAQEPLPVKIAEETALPGRALNLHGTGNGERFWFLKGP